MSDSFAVEFKNVTKAFGDVQAVRNLNLSIEKGQLVTYLVHPDVEKQPLCV